MVADLEELETMDASEIYSKRLNAKEVIFPKERGEFIFPIADGRIKPLGGDQDLRTSTSIRQRPIQGESHLVFLGESEGSLPPPHDSFPDAGEAVIDFWSMSGNFIYRHHVEPRVKLYSPRKESLPIPLKFSRSTHTHLDGQGDGVPKACPEQAAADSRVPNLRVCKHFPREWHTQGEKDELTSCLGTV